MNNKEMVLVVYYELMYQGVNETGKTEFSSLDAFNAWVEEQRSRGKTITINKTMYMSRLANNVANGILAGMELFESIKSRRS